MTGKDDISRRALLGSLGTVGGAGAVFGAGTTALFTDTERFEESVVSSGPIDVLVSWKDQTTEDGTVTVTFDLSDGKATTNLTITPDETSNPAAVWIRPTCPTGPADSIVNVEFTLPDCGETVYSGGSLPEVVDDLRKNGGVRLETASCGGCISPDEQIELEIYWEFSESADYNAENPDDVKLDFEFRAIQCRYDPGSPFKPLDPCHDSGDNQDYHGISYIEIYADDDEDGSCGDEDSPLGKIELTPKDNYDQSGIGESHIEPETYDLYEDDSGDDTGYDVEVTDTVEKDGGEETVAVAFELIDINAESEGTGPSLCKVNIKGSEITTYTGFDDNTTGGPLYAPENDNGGPG